MVDSSGVEYVLDDAREYSVQEAKGEAVRIVDSSGTEVRVADDGVTYARDDGEATVKIADGNISTTVKSGGGESSLDVADDVPPSAKVDAGDQGAEATGGGADAAGGDVVGLPVNPVFVVLGVLLAGCCVVVFVVLRRRRVGGE